MFVLIIYRITFAQKNINIKNIFIYKKMSGISPECFGPPTWALLHMISFNYPDKIDRTKKEDIVLMNDTYKFFMYLGSVIPCEECRKHYKERFAKKNLMASLDGKANFTKWVYDFHNEVNKFLGKQEPSFEDVMKRYNALLNDKCDNACKAGSKYYCKMDFVEKDDETTKSTEMFANINVNNSHIFLMFAFVIVMAFITRWSSSNSSSNSNSNFSKKKRASI